MRLMEKDRPSRAKPTTGPDLPAGAEDVQTPGAGQGPRRRPSPEPGHFLQGRLLIATPSIGDPRFERTVLLICVHDEHQAMALVLNRPLKGLSVPALLRRIGLGGQDVPDAPVLFGGPVEPERGYVLHTDDYDAPPSTLAVAPGVGLTDTREVLDALGDARRRPRRFVLALGYAGWGAGQLDAEIRQGAWLIGDADEALVFGPDLEGRWDAALGKIGVRPDRLSAQVGRA